MAKRGVESFDFSFPKNVQGVFAKLEESKVRILVGLENARTQATTARALKNEMELMKEMRRFDFFSF
ncbi:hypothetical protein [Leptospira weilii]|uniref:Uncharacterized protein n=1 Tax=Leptospira weilii str. UI 13098 TaxID=1088542 RepID=M6QLP0_9LEPT|nr:hypothetical protein [Leptospira weilii]EMN89812.1 hypothetical protein LEP1GSC108_2583 [Leptospira weilii str. UI 13098]OMI18321.1 stomatin-like protein [Leptospira weilii serovar Heyan]